MRLRMSRRTSCSAPGREATLSGTLNTRSIRCRRMRFPLIVRIRLRPRRSAGSISRFTRPRLSRRSATTVTFDGSQCSRPAACFCEIDVPGWSCMSKRACVLLRPMSSATSFIRSNATAKVSWCISLQISSAVDAGTRSQSSWNSRPICRTVLTPQYILGGCNLLNQSSI
jgi:hypothetical protein